MWSLQLARAEGGAGAACCRWACATSRGLFRSSVTAAGSPCMCDSHKWAPPGLPALFDVPHPLYIFSLNLFVIGFQSSLGLCQHWSRSAGFSLPEVTTRTHSPFHKPNAFTVCTSTLPNGFSQPLLSLFLQNTSYRNHTLYFIRCLTSCVQWHRHFSKKTGNASQSTARICLFSQPRHHSSSVLHKSSFSTTRDHRWPPPCGFVSAVTLQVHTLM